MPKMIHHRIDVLENPCVMRDSNVKRRVAWRHRETEMFVVAEERLAAVKRMTLEAESLRANNEGQV